MSKPQQDGEKGADLILFVRPIEVGFDISDAVSYVVLDSIRTVRTPMVIGYARVSTADQTAGLASQERDLRAVGAERIFSEQTSSVARREQLAECLRYLREGDVLAVTKPDRLARSTAELLAIEADLTTRGVGLLVLSMGGQQLDTRDPTARLILSILGSVATWEREIMLERQREGIRAAKEAGKYRGRKSSLDAAEIERLAAEMGPAQIAKHLGIARSSVYRLLDVKAKAT